MMLDQHISENSLRGSTMLREAASDVFDGGVYLIDVDELRRRRWIRIVPVSNGHDATADRREQLCGTSWTAELTERAVLKFWSDRKKQKPRSGGCTSSQKRTDRHACHRGSQ